MEEKCMSSTALGAEKAIIFISDDTRRNIKSILDSQHRAEGTGKADDDWEKRKEEILSII